MNYKNIGGGGVWIQLLGDTSVTRVMQTSESFDQVKVAFTIMRMRIMYQERRQGDFITTFRIGRGMVIQISSRISRTLVDLIKVCSSEHIYLGVLSCIYNPLSSVRSHHHNLFSICTQWLWFITMFLTLERHLVAYWKSNLDSETFQLMCGSFDLLQDGHICSEWSNNCRRNWWNLHSQLLSWQRPTLLLHIWH